MCLHGRRAQKPSRVSSIKGIIPTERAPPGVLITSQRPYLLRPSHRICASLLTCSMTLCNPRTLDCQAPLSMGFPRQKYWSGLPFPSPGDLSNPGIESRSLPWQADSLPSKPSHWGLRFQCKNFGRHDYAQAQPKLHENHLCTLKLPKDAPSHNHACT